MKHTLTDEDSISETYVWGKVSFSAIGLSFALTCWQRPADLSREVNTGSQQHICVRLSLTVVLKNSVIS